MEGSSTAMRSATAPDSAFTRLRSPPGRQRQCEVHDQASAFAPGCSSCRSRPTLPAPPRTTRGPPMSASDRNDSQTTLGNLIAELELLLTRLGDQGSQRYRDATVELQR